MVHLLVFAISASFVLIAPTGVAFGKRCGKRYYWSSARRRCVLEARYRRRARRRVRVRRHRCGTRYFWSSARRRCVLKARYRRRHR